MSHISKIEIVIVDLDAFEAACRELGVELRRNQKTFKSFAGAKHPCEMAVVDAANQEAYELGLVRARYDNNQASRTFGQVVQDPNGSAYMALTDNWDGGKGLNEKIGENAGLLMQRYGLNAARRQAAQQGMSVVREERLPNGSVRMVFEPRKQYAQAGAYGSGY